MSKKYESERIKITRELERDKDIYIGVGRTLTLETIEDFKNSQKFLMPPGGRLIDDKLRGLPEKVRLPFPVTSVIVPPSIDDMKCQEGKPEKLYGIVVIASQEEEGTIFIRSFLEYGSSKSNTHWYLSPFTTGLEFTTFTSEDGRRGIKTTSTALIAGISGDAPNVKRIESETLRIVLELVEALSCSNVNHKLNARAKATKRGEPLMYDEYHTLVIEQKEPKQYAVGTPHSSHRAPREHLRRGFINTYHTKTGIVKHWINSVIVNPGVGGKVLKNYQLA